MRVIFLLSVLSIVKAYALSSQAQDKAPLLINVNTTTMQSDTITETTPIAKSKRRISNGSTGNMQEDANIVRVAQHKTNAIQEDAQHMKTANTSVHQLRGGKSRKPEESKSRHSATSKAGGDVGSIGTVTGRRKLNSMHDLFNKRIDEWEFQDWLLALLLLFVLSIVLRVLGRIHCCGCSVLDCLAGFLCWQICCDPSPGMNYGVFA
jgi:hypothetical protein